MNPAARVGFVRQCAFCSGPMDRSAPEVMLTLESRLHGAVSFVGHGACFRHALHPDAAPLLDLADVALAPPAGPAGPSAPVA